MVSRFQKLRRNPVVRALKPALRPLRRAFWHARTLVTSVRAGRKQARYVGKTIAITGSVGKSTATMLTHRLLAADHSVASTAGRNTGLDAVRLLEGLRQPTDFVVQEVSAMPPGHYDLVLRSIRIDVAVVVRVGLDHASHFRTDDAVARAKGRLAEKAHIDGVVCLNADDARCRAMASRTRARVVLFGKAGDAEVRAEAIDATWPDRMSFDLVIGGVRRRARTRFVGTMFLPSVLAALSVVHALGLDIDVALVRLETLDPYPKRLSVVDHPSGHTLVMDTSKASHWSTLSLIDDLQNWGPARRIFVLGEMSDIRNDASRRYKRVMQLLADRADLVIGIGGRSTSAARKVNRANVVAAPTMTDLIDILRRQPPSLVILKSNKSLALNPLATAEFSLSVDHPAPQ